MQNKNAAQKSSNPTLLAGIVVCAHCGAKMSAFLHQRPAVLPAWISCPLPAAFSGSPLRGHRRVSHADGHAVFKVQQAKRKQKSRHRTDQPCLRFFWKVMLVGYVTAESQNVQPRRSERICKNMLYSIVGIDYHKNRAVSTKSFGNTLISAGCKKKQGKLWQKERGLDDAYPLDKAIIVKKFRTHLHPGFVPVCRMPLQSERSRAIMPL